MQGLVEEAAHGTGALATPQVDKVVVAARRGEDVDCGLECLVLRGEQRLVVEAGPFAQDQLDEQFGADVAEVFHRGVQPSLGQPPALRGRSEYHAIAADAGGVTAAHHKVLVHESIDGAIGERAAERPYPTDFAVGSEDRAEGPAVGDSLRDEREADMFREGQLERRRRRCAARLAANTGGGRARRPAYQVLMGVPFRSALI